MTSAELVTQIKKQPVGFLCGLVVVTCLAWSYYRGDEIGLRQADYDAKAAEAAKVSTNVRNGEKLSLHVEEITALAKEVNGRLLRVSQLAVNLQYFYKLEAETQVKLIDVRQGQLAKAANAKAATFSPIPFTVSLQGSFPQVMKFVQRLEAGPYFCRFNNISFNKVEGQGAESDTGAIVGAMNVTMNLELLGQP